MKRRDLEQRLRIAGCYLKREGASHSLWINPKDGTTEAVPRHTEIKDPLTMRENKSVLFYHRELRKFMRALNGTSAIRYGIDKQ